MDEPVYEYLVEVNDQQYFVYGDDFEANERALVIYHQQTVTFMTTDVYTVYNKTKTDDYNNR